MMIRMIIESKIITALPLMRMMMMMMMIMIMT